VFVDLRFHEGLFRSCVSEIANSKWNKNSRKQFSLRGTLKIYLLLRIARPFFVVVFFLFINALGVCVCELNAEEKFLLLFLWIKIIVLLTAEQCRRKSSQVELSEQIGF